MEGVALRRGPVRVTARQASIARVASAGLIATRTATMTPLKIKKALSQNLGEGL